MPELPEVETVRRGLLPVMEGRRIAQAEARRPDLRWPLPKDMGQRLSGAQVTALRRRSKYILADLDRGETLIIHLGMSGRILIAPPIGDAAQLGSFHHTHAAPGRHDHVIFDMEDGSRITFNDARRFGAMDLVATSEAERHKMLAHLGPEPLGNSFHEDYLAKTLSGRMTPIKSALLDQRVVAGLGNIYVCEALFRAGISPIRKAGRISASRLSALVPVIREVLHEAIEAGGSSLRDYRQTDGDLGYFQHSFQVYGREDQPCLNPGCSGTIQRKIQAGRSTFYCPQCQR
ncbi:MAG: bifunctional DNA-formamidopyrimidine glycosylase/DNA-(apurinic or apyrimidinic site) lyase [Mangrovicoccus sp.]|nr:bifunctional DNA-formamidopyrimidine glycosylase/DNA-(apurinic or apyrimidinic site) lyase [Mangrovicoccus sp.]